MLLKTLNKGRLRKQKHVRNQFRQERPNNFQINSFKLSGTHFQKNWECFKIIDANQKAKLLSSGTAINKMFQMIKEEMKLSAISFQYTHKLQAFL